MSPTKPDHEISDRTTAAPEGTPRPTTRRWDRRPRPLHRRPSRGALLHVLGAGSIAAPRPARSRGALLGRGRHREHPRAQRSTTSTTARPTPRRRRAPTTALSTGRGRAVRTMNKTTDEYNDSSNGHCLLFALLTAPGWRTARRCSCSAPAVVWAWRSSTWLERWGRVFAAASTPESVPRRLCWVPEAVSTQVPRT